MISAKDICLLVHCSVCMVAQLCCWEKDNFGQSIWYESVVKLGTYGGTHWELQDSHGKLMGTHWELDENTLRPGNKPKKSEPNHQEWMHCKHNILGKNTGNFFCQANHHTLECFSFQTYFTRHLLGCSGTHFTQGKGQKMNPNWVILLVQPLKGIPRALHLESKRPN